MIKYGSMRSTKLSGLPQQSSSSSLPSSLLHARHPNEPAGNVVTNVPNTLQQQPRTMNATTTNELVRRAKRKRRLLRKLSSILNRKRDEMSYDPLEEQQTDSAVRNPSSKIPPPQHQTSVKKLQKLQSSPAPQSLRSTSESGTPAESGVDKELFQVKRRFDENKEGGVLNIPTSSISSSGRSLSSKASNSSASSHKSETSSLLTNDSAHRHRAGESSPPPKQLRQHHLRKELSSSSLSSISTGDGVGLSSDANASQLRDNKSAQNFNHQSGQATSDNMILQCFDFITTSTPSSQALGLNPDYVEKSSKPVHQNDRRVSMDQLNRLSDPSDDSSSHSSLSSRVVTPTVEYNTGPNDVSCGDPATSTLTPTLPKRPKKNVRFADDLGKDLEHVHYTQTMYSEEDLDWVRSIILLLSPEKKKFEFLHVSYNTLDKTSIALVLEQLPSLATDVALQEQRYLSLVRAETSRELINTVAIQSYQLRRDELLVAVNEGIYGKTLMRMAKPLIQNKKILRAVKRAKATGRTVKKLSSSSAAFQKQQQYAKEGVALRKANEQNPAAPISVTGLKKARIVPMVRPNQEEDDGYYSNTSDEEDSDEEEYAESSDDEMPEIDSEPDSPTSSHTKQLYYQQQQQQREQKVHVARFLNFGILTALVVGKNEKKFWSRKSR